MATAADHEANITLMREATRLRMHRWVDNFLDRLEKDPAFVSVYTSENVTSHEDDGTLLYATLVPMDCVEGKIVQREQVTT